LAATTAASAVLDFSPDTEITKNGVMKATSTHNVDGAGLSARDVLPSPRRSTAITTVPSITIRATSTVTLRRNRRAAPAARRVDFFSAIVSGLAHQQVANDPGGDRWVVLVRRVVEAMLADIDRRSGSTSRTKPTQTRRAKE
jgi:hypothetical protein